LAAVDVCELGGRVDVTTRRSVMRNGCGVRSWGVPRCRLTGSVLDFEWLAGGEDLRGVGGVHEIDNIAAAGRYAREKHADVARRSICWACQVCPEL
jgi:hypothetical protein